MDDIKQLKTEIGERLARLHALEAKARDAKNAGLLGKCFKYRNCYSCPGPEDYWHLYAQVIAVADGGLRAFRFQTDKDGKVEIEPDTYFSASEGYLPITFMEFAEAWEALTRRIERMPTASGNDPKRSVE